MKYLRNAIAFLFVLCFFSVYSQTRLTKGVSHFPSYQAVVTQFYTHYRPKGDPDPNAMLQFARQPDGWYIITNTIQDQNTKTITPFWQPANGFLNLNGIFSILDSEKDVPFPHYQSEAFVRDNHTIRMFNLHTYYGYQGWADDIVTHLRPFQLELSDEDLYSLGRAHSARASAMMHHNPDGSNLPKVEYKHSGNSMTDQQLTDYYRENLAARECFKIIANRNPVFYDIVGKIQTKYANEVMQAYSDLLIFQNEELGKRQLIPNIYPPELVAHARNYLNNLPKGALFISFGDNDTYPL